MTERSQREDGPPGGEEPRMGVSRAPGVPGPAPRVGSPARVPPLSSKLPEGAGRTGKAACLHRGPCMTRLPLAKLGLAPLEMRLGRPCQHWLSTLHVCGGREPWKARLALCDFLGRGCAHPCAIHLPQQQCCVLHVKGLSETAPPLAAEVRAQEALPPLLWAGHRKPTPPHCFSPGPDVGGATARQARVPRCSPSQTAEHHCSTPGLSPGLLSACTPCSSRKPF